MPQIRIIKRIPENEVLQIYVDGDQVFDDEIQCNEEFSLAINQYIEPRDPESVKKNLVEILLVFVLGGRKEGGKEVTPPWQAQWEGNCQAPENGTLNIFLFMHDGHPSIEVQSEEVEITVTKSKEVIRELDKKVWEINILVFAIPFALFILGASIFMISTIDKDSWYFVVPFMCYMWILSSIAFYRAYREFRKTKKKLSPEERAKDTNKRIKIALIMLKVTVTVSIIGAVIQIISGWMIEIPWAGLTAIPVAVVFILSVAFSNAVFSKDEANYYQDDESQKGAAEIVRWNRNAWIFAIIGILCAVFVA